MGPTPSNDPFPTTLASADDGSSILNDRTPLIRSSSSTSSFPSHTPPPPRRKHSHTLGGTVIVAISNYSCDEGREEDDGDDDDDGACDAEEGEPRHHHRHRHRSASVVDRWAPVQDDGTEPLVIFHPRHAVHPHHPGGPSLLRLSSDDVHVACVGRHSSSIDDDGGGEGYAPSSTGTTGGATPDDVGGAAAECRMANAHPPPPSHGGRPNSWGEASRANSKEFWEHWRDFFHGIYSSGRNRDDGNDDKSVWDVIALTIELPFTIARKVGPYFSPRHPRARGNTPLLIHRSSPTALSFLFIPNLADESSPMRWLLLSTSRRHIHDSLPNMASVLLP